jgi:hypothetical protein
VTMDLMRRAIYGALGGLGGALVLTVFRKVLAAVWVVGTSAPEQVVERLEELGLVDDWSPEARRALTRMAHVAYDVGSGTALGLLRREKDGVAEEAAVGSALGILIWGRGGQAGCLSQASIGRRGSSAPRRCFCRSSIMLSSVSLGGFCTEP